jgi:hypothetical protein
MNAAPPGLKDGADKHGQQSGDPLDDEPPVLEFQTFADLAAEVDAAGARRWLIRGIWPAGDYGVHAAESKVQKTWNAADLAMSVAAGRPWLGGIPIDTTGPVLIFIGEGGKGNIVRRIRAIAEHRGVVAETLPIVVCARAPRLGDDTHMNAMTEQIEQMRPALVVLDPLYLSAQGGNLADLYAMGELLERPQRVCQERGASLFVVHHFNRKHGTGRERMSGAGPAEWGRVLITATVSSRRKDPVTKATDVATRLTIVGGEIPDQALRVQRRIWSDHPDDLDSPLHLRVSVTELGEVVDGDDEPLARERDWNDPGQPPLPDDVRQYKGHG